jgi:hypothetical protein
LMTNGLVRIHMVFNYMCRVVHYMK